MIATHAPVAPLKWNTGLAPGHRVIPEETAVAIVVNGGTHAVMMATPADLEDFATGFALTEGIVDSLGEIERFEVLEYETGVEARLWVAAGRARALAARRRAMAGPSGCGLCGIESLGEAMRPVRPVAAGLTLSAAQVLEAVASLRPAQSLNALTQAVHAAGLWSPGEGLSLLREDVGRHNALDKLVGAAARQGADTTGAALLLTSRVSIEMVQKAAVLGAGIVIAVSAPTATALRAATAAGITLVAIARADGFEIFTGEERII